ncbi:uncharacterized protein TM35_000381820 [Trypanosoma theileri]|uniref:Secreted protein n=1 Tax=Trypanosoma theileri TaxID=67003 RepID=A0A1X0NKD0_9TRYP|nr:uncharacterized protein TM35_000381820 [Trypanosoma theileri]ORC85107.1 hypothetical protein TM35_000381820 [Trypanosoma theileri]
MAPGCFFFSRCRCAAWGVCLSAFCPPEVRRRGNPPQHPCPWRSLPSAWGSDFPAERMGAVPLGNGRPRGPFPPLGWWLFYRAAGDRFGAGRGVGRQARSNTDTIGECQVAALGRLNGRALFAQRFRNRQGDWRRLFGWAK